MDGIDIDELMNTIVSCLDNEVIGEIVDICSSEGDTVKIVIDYRKHLKKVAHNEQPFLVYYY